MPSGVSDQMVPSLIVHATCVAYRGQGLLITGASGSGKSALALQMLGYGCDLVADDRVALFVDVATLMAKVPKNLPHLIEARGIGLLNVSLVGPAKLVAVVDMDIEETDRLPQTREIAHLGQTVPLFYKVDGPHFAAGLVQMLKHGWHVLE